ncbi:formylglycine-generating enzyme family protein [bacterium]
MKKIIIISIIVFAVFVFAFSHKLKNKEQVLAAREYSVAPAEEGMLRVSVNGHNFDIDIYEYPNAAEEYPRGNMKYPDAKEACESAGKRLCTNGEWTEACRGAVMRKYPFGDTFSDNKELCNNIHGSRNNVRSGSFEQCTTNDGLHDMGGNLWEWVQKSDTGAWLAKGGSYRDGELSHRCEFTFKLFESQAESLSFDNFGTRCCRDVEE